MTQETAPLVFVREDWRLFLNLATLGQKAGVARHLIGALVIKELVDNALDAGAHVEVKEMDGGWMAVEDDGPGIDPDKIASLFSVNRPLTSTKLLRRPLRGALGNGLRVVVGAVYASDGQLRIRTRGKWATVLPEASGESTGVAECDEYVKKMEACMSKVPAAAKPGMETAFKATRDSFKSSGATPEGKAALKTSCKALVDGLAQNPACK